MRYLIYVISITMILTGCVHDTPSGFQPYVSMFRKSAIQEGVGIDIALKLVYTTISMTDNLPGNAIGICIPFPNEPIVLVLRSYWDGADELHRKALIYHELGHCLLNDAHTTERLPDGHPISLMYPSISGVDDEKYVLSHWKYYQHELFWNHHKLPKIFAD